MFSPLLLRRDGSNILSCIPTTNIFIEAGLDHGGVLVHCFGGKSRSPAFIAAYLMSSCNWGFDEAYRVIKSARPAVEINLGFEYQLRAYAAAKYDVYIAQQLILRARIRELHFLRGDPAVLNVETNVSDHLNSTKLSVAHLLGNQRPLQQRLDQITAKNLAQHRADIGAQQKGSKRSLDDSKHVPAGCVGSEDDSCMDVDGTDGEESSTFRSPYRSQQPTEGLEESVDSLTSNMSADSTSGLGLSSVGRQNKMPKENYGDDVRDRGDKEQARDRTPMVTFHAGSHEPSPTKTPKSKRHVSHGARHAGGSGTSPESQNPSCRLSRPGSSVVRVIPPLRGLEREFKCAWCHTALFSLASVLRTDVNLVEMLEDFLLSLQTCAPEHRRREETEPGPDLEETFLKEAQGIAVATRGDGMAPMQSPRLPGSRHPLPPIRSGGVTIVEPASMPAPSVGLSLSTPTSTSDDGAPPSSMADMEMDIEDNDYTPFVPPLKTSRANKNPAGFQFDIPESTEPAPSVPSLALGGDRALGSFRSGGAAGSSHSLHVQESATSHSNGMKVTPRKLLPSLDHASSSSSSSPSPATLLPPSSPRVPNSPRLEPLLLSSSSVPHMPLSDLKPFQRNNSTGSGIGLSLSCMSKDPGSGRHSNDNSPSDGLPAIIPPKNTFFAALYPGLNPPVHGKLCFDISPRVVVPPHTHGVNLGLGLGSGGNASSGGPAVPGSMYPSNRMVARPASAEKRRWLARVSLLREDGRDHKDGKGRETKDGFDKVVALADQDDGAVAFSLATSGSEQYFYVEYLDWMGKEVFESPGRDYSDICCKQCRKVVGCWNWTPSSR